MIKVDYAGLLNFMALVDGAAAFIAQEGYEISEANITFTYVDGDTEYDLRVQKVDVVGGDAAVTAHLYASCADGKIYRLNFNGITEVK